MSRKISNKKSHIFWKKECILLSKKFLKGDDYIFLQYKICNLHRLHTDSKLI